MRRLLPMPEDLGMRRTESQGAFRAAILALRWDLAKGHLAVLAKVRAMHRRVLCGDVDRERRGQQETNDACKDRSGAACACHVRSFAEGTAQSDQQPLHQVRCTT